LEDIYSLSFFGERKFTFCPFAFECPTVSDIDLSLTLQRKEMRKILKRRKLLKKELKNLNF
jgi:hypothetical protein